MSWITKRQKCGGKIEWLYRWSEHGKRFTRVVPGAKTRRQAERIKRQWDYQRDVEKDVGNKGKEWTLETAHHEVMDFKTCSPRFRTELDRYFKRSFFPFFGRSRRLSDITVGDIKRWVAWRKQHTGRSGGTVRNSTVRHEFYALSQCFQAALEFGRLRSNPCASISLKRILPNDLRRRERVLNPAEIQRLIEASDGHVKTFVVLAWATAGRMGELLQLEWSDIDVERETITFRHDPPCRTTKNKRTRSVPVSREILAFVVDNHPRVAASSWVFSHPDGSRIKNVKTGVRLAAKRAGLEGVTAHVIRHSVNSALLAAGFSQAVVRDHVGHSDFRMTSHYAHTLEEERRAAAIHLAKVGNQRDREQEEGFLKKFPYDKTRQEIVELCSSSEFIRSVESITGMIKRETGIEPATLSLGS